MSAGRVAAWLAEASAEEGSAMPAMAESGPVLLPGLSLFLQAFEDLSPSRPSTAFGPGAIPFEAIDRYARRFGIDDPDDFDDLLRAVRVLDDAYLVWGMSRAEEHATHGGKPSCS